MKLHLMLPRTRVLQIALVLGVLSPRPTAAQAPSATEALIREMLDSSAVAWNRGDLEGHLHPDADSVRFMTAKGPIIGKRATADALRRSYFRDGKPVQQLRFEQVTVTPMGPRHALVVGRFVLEGGGRAERSGWFTTIWERRPEGWRIIHDHSS